MIGTNVGYSPAVSSYYMNEAALFLPGAASVLDRTTHEIDVTLEGGVELRLMVVRRALDPAETVKARLAEMVAEKDRALHGFSVISLEERAYPSIAGLELRVRYRDEGTVVFQHQLHAAIVTEQGVTWIAFHGETDVEHAELCDRWMAAMLAEVRLRDG